MKRSIGHIEKLAEGKYLLRLSAQFDDFGKRIQVSKTVYCKNDKAAEIELMNFYAEKDKYIADKLSKVPETLKALYNEWLENHVKRNLAPRTIESYKGLWKYIESKQNVKLKSLTPKALYKIIDDIGKGDRTVNAVYKMLNAMLNKAMKWGYINDNPCKRIDTPKYKPNEQSTLAGANIYDIVDIVVQEDTKYQVIFYLAAICGLRCQEIVGLKWDDINFAEQTFRIVRGATGPIGQGTFTKETKNKKSNRVMHMPDVLHLALKKLEVEQKEHRIKLGEKWINEDWIFSQWNGAIMNVTTPSHWWSKLRKANSNVIPKVTFHGLRHTAATIMLQNGVSISDVSDALGHALKSTTLNFYAHVIEDTKKSAINVSANAFIRPLKKEEEIG